MKKLLFLAGLLLLPGCATQGHFKDSLDTWLNHSLDEYVIQNGPPFNTYELQNGQTVNTFHFGGGATAVRTSAYTSSIRNNFCDVSFVVDEKKIIRSYSFRGNACVKR